MILTLVTFSNRKESSATHSFPSFLILSPSLEACLIEELKLFLHDLLQPPDTSLTT